mgnify:FL=1
MDNMHAIMVIAVATLVTMLLRFIPFLVFGGGKETPKVITYLGNVLPYAIMAMLLVYCLKGTVITAFPYGIPEAISCAAVVLLHLWKRNTLISIVGGTICYMVLVQMVF